MQQSLFDQKGLSQPLADRLRPQTLEDYVGQEHLLGPGKVLRQMIQQKQFHNYGRNYFSAVFSLPF